VTADTPGSGRRPGGAAARALAPVAAICHAHRVTLRVGERAPAFSRTAHDGRTIEVGAGEREQALVLYFYPADETLGCTMQACKFRDEDEDFVGAGAMVVGVSPNSLDEHRSFAEHHRLPFPLLSDADGELRRRYDVGRSLGIISGRVTYVIDRQGIIQHVFSSQLRARQHVAEALGVLERVRRG
jgi:thioredoxin-dependent peroxiredoxin